MKTLYYCMGGGLGHITRFLAFCHTTGVNADLVTNSPAAAQGLITLPKSSTFQKSG